MTRRVRGACALLLAAALAVSALADIPPLVLDHDELVARARAGGLRDAGLTYTLDRAILRGRVRHLMVWWPIRVEAVFVRDGARVRMRALELRVRSRVMAARLADADARLARLVDVASAGARVEIRRSGAVVYTQDLHGDL